MLSPISLTPAQDPDLGMAERLFGHDGMQTLLKIVGRHPDVLLA